MIDERTGVLARMRTGVDVKKERERRTWAVAALAAGVGVGVAMWANKAQASSAAVSSLGPLTQAGLVREGFSTGLTQRILAVQEYVDRYAHSRNLDHDFINGVILAESRFYTKALSPVGAQGLMQIMPGTQDYYEGIAGVKGDVFAPDHNIMLGTLGLRRHLDRWNGNVPRTLASYNWGVGNVIKHPDAYPAVTDKYIVDVAAGKERFKRARL